MPPRSYVCLGLRHVACLAVATTLALVAPIACDATFVPVSSRLEREPSHGRSLRAGDVQADEFSNPQGSGTVEQGQSDTGTLGTTTLTEYTRGVVARADRTWTRPGGGSAMDYAGTLGSALHNRHRPGAEAQAGALDDSHSGASAGGGMEGAGAEVDASATSVVISGFERTRSDANTSKEPKTPLSSIPTGSLDYRNVSRCVSRTAWMVNHDYHPLPSNFKVLFIIGAQKAGTTWLWQALNTSPAFQRATKPSGSEMKEPHYFMREPVFRELDTDGYVKMFARDAPRDFMTRLAAGEVAMLDGTPGYLPRPVAAARMKYLVPHARIVVVLRDPVARAISALKMYWARACGAIPLNRTTGELTEPCSMEPMHVMLERAIDAVRSDPTGEETCFFPTVDDDNQLYPECGCQSFPGVAKVFRLSNYAPSLAWWLAFFPPERFVIVTNDQFKGPERTQMLNKIIEHAGLPEAGKFTSDVVVPDEVANHSNYGSTIPEEVVALVPALREVFRQPMEELKALLDRHFPEMHFTGLNEEL